ncbi:copper amine oxidase domain protein [Paenibacillus algicola]|uniref:Copper amine oxidase domain protein n=2 Tax=Paenibacillus algicola TaxID=2565926 RepID=A0A4P8XMR0_9BACL|nr:copper amine oxidase domain protein [Paenibacillus algicola]
MTMNKLIGSLMASILLSTVIHSGGSVNGAAHREQPHTMDYYIDHQMVSVEVAPAVQQGELYVPVYLMKDWRGISLKWNHNAKELSMTADGQRYAVKSGSARVSLPDGSYFTLKSPVYIEHNRMMVPLSLFEQISGGKASVSEDPKALVIDSRGKRPLAYGEADKSIAIYGEWEQEGRYQALTLDMNGNQHTYPWATPVSWKSSPQLLDMDVNGDGSSEIVVLLNQGSGTGVYAQDVHVIRADFSEVSVESFHDILKERVVSSIQHQEGVLLLSVQVDGEETRLALPDEEGSRTNFTHVGFGSVVYHAVEDGRLVLRLAGSISPSEFIGELAVVYGWSEGRLAAEQISFTPYDEYMQYMK